MLGHVVGVEPQGEYHALRTYRAEMLGHLGKALEHDVDDVADDLERKRLHLRRGLDHDAVP